ncbi:MAG: VanZ family protein [Rhizobiaceae bacterium]|nr:VanZ family protein [Rhizobiaceae bacterium]MCZ8351781.1 VanZ family protein [Rhizobium sp.]
MNIRTFALVAAWTGLALIVLVTVSPIDLRPSDLTTTDLDRALAFFVMSCLFVIAYPRRAAKVSLALIFSAFAIELTQFISVTRHPELHDALIKTAGVALGIGAGLLVNSCFGKRDGATRAAG